MFTTAGKIIGWKSVRIRPPAATLDPQRFEISIESDYLQPRNICVEAKLRLKLNNGPKGFAINRIEYIPEVNEAS